MTKKKNFENSLNRLEEITKKMEESEIPLDTALKLYKEGVDEAIFCFEFLKEVEQEVNILQKNSNGLFKLTKFHDMEEY